MPAHNAARYLRAALTSVLAQSWRDLEVLVVDDGSADDPGAVVASLGDERIRFWSRPASGGPSRPRNEAIAAARGRYVFFCDADDEMQPGKIERQVAEFERHPRLGLVFSDFQVIDEDGRIVSPSFLAHYGTFRRILRAGRREHGGLDEKRVASGLLRANYIGTSGVAVRREVLAEVGLFDESLSSSEDFDLWLRIARRYPLGYVDMIGHSYRQHGTSLMREFARRHPLARIEVLQRQLALPLDRRDRLAVRRRLAVNHCSLGYVCERERDLAAARECFHDSFRMWPSLGAAWGWLKARSNIDTQKARRAGLVPDLSVRRRRKDGR